MDGPLVTLGYLLRGTGYGLVPSAFATLAALLLIEGLVVAIAHRRRTRNTTRASMASA